MKAAFVSAGPKVRIEDVPIPKPNADQVLIKVVVSGSNPKDWKACVPLIVPSWMGDDRHQGDDIAGVVHEVGANVTEFKPGDRVAAFHEMRSPNGSYAEYAIAWQHTTFHIPKTTSFEEAAAIPLAALTAAIGLHRRLGLPEPWNPAPEPAGPLVIYGAASSVGAYAVQLARRANIHPLICVAGKSAAHVESLIDRGQGDTVIDYRAAGGDDAVVREIRKAAAASGRKLLRGFDAISERGSYVNLSRALDAGDAKVTVVLPVAEEAEAEAEAQIPGHVKVLLTMVGDAHGDAKDFAFVYLRYLGRGLQEGWFKGQPQVVVPGGLAGIQKALEDLQAGRANAVKYVFRIAETEGVGA